MLVHESGYVDALTFNLAEDLGIEATTNKSGLYVDLIS